MRILKHEVLTAFCKNGLSPVSSVLYHAKSINQKPTNGWCKYVVFVHILRHSNNRFVSFRSRSLVYLLVHSRCRGCLFSLDRTQTHTTVGRIPLDEGSARRRDLYLTT
jgi:hypothetical protein